MGSSPLRSDTGHSPELDFQPPLRNTRSEPVVSPVGLVGGVTSDHCERLLWGRFRCPKRMMRTEEPQQWRPPTNLAPTSSPPATKTFRRLAHEQTLNEDKIDGGQTKLGCVLTHVGNETRQHTPSGEIKLADSSPPPILGRSRSPND